MHLFKIELTNIMVSSQGVSFCFILHIKQIIKPKISLVLKSFLKYDPVHLYIDILFKLLYLPFNIVLKFFRRAPLPLVENITQEKHSFGTKVKTILLSYKLISFPLHLIMPSDIIVTGLKYFNLNYFVRLRHYKMAGCKLIYRQLSCP